MIWYLRSRAIVRLNFRGVPPRWELFADILNVGVPGLINIAITNLSVVVLTGIAGQLGRDTALGLRHGCPRRRHPATGGVRIRHRDCRDGRHQLGRGAVSSRPRDRLDRHGDGRVCVRHDRPDCRVPWIGLFSDDAEVARLGTLYLRIVGPAYLLFGLGLGLFYVTLGFGRAVAAMNANAVRMMTSAGLGLVAVYGFDLGVSGFFAAVAAGFCVYGALLVHVVFSVRTPVAALATNS